MISESIPPELVAELLRSLDADVVLEIPSLDDPMVGLLLEQKMNLKDYRDRYDGARITRALENRFEIRRRVQIGTRSILHLVPRI